MRHPGSRVSRERRGIERQQERGAFSRIEHYRQNDIPHLPPGRGGGNKDGLARMASRLFPNASFTRCDIGLGQPA